MLGVLVILVKVPFESRPLFVLASSVISDIPVPIIFWNGSVTS